MFYISDGLLVESSTKADYLSMLTVSLAFSLAVSLVLGQLTVGIHPEHCSQLFKLQRIQTWSFIPIIPALRKLRQEDRDFKASLYYIGRSRYINK
jgi:hypothetical protein